MLGEMLRNRDNDYYRVGKRAGGGVICIVTWYIFCTIVWKIGGVGILIPIKVTQ